MSDLPKEVVDEAERLTRLAREAVDEAEARAYRRERDGVLADHGYAARVRTDDDGDVLACYPTDWVEDGVVRPDRVDDVDRGVERRLSGPGAGDDWEEVAAGNDALVERVREAHGEVHGANARALADFAGNHYAKAVTELTRAELLEFRDEYFPRNAWPTDEQSAAVDQSIRLTFAVADARCPLEE